MRIASRSRRQRERYAVHVLRVLDMQRDSSVEKRVELPRETGSYADRRESQRNYYSLFPRITLLSRAINATLPRGRRRGDNARNARSCRRADGNFVRVRLSSR